MVKIRIALDCRWVSGDSGGIRQYTLNLVKNLSLIDKANEYFLIYDDVKTRELLEANIRNSGNFHFYFLNCGPFSLLNQVVLPIKLNRQKINVFHSPNFMMPLFAGKGCKTVITIHDLIPFLFPEMCAQSKKVKALPVFKKLISYVAGKTDKIITDSNNSQKDILRVFSLPESKVKVIYIGISDCYRVDKNNLAKKNFLLYVGRQDPSKNLLGIIKAFARLKNRDNYQLVITGKKDNRYPEPYSLVSRMNLEKEIVFTGVVSGEELFRLYNSAALFVFPSLYEGFGLPPLEAMACGCPVITSNTSSLPEVVGDAGVLVNPYDVNELAKAMERVLEDGDLREKLIKKGLERVKLFSWQKAASQTLEVYESLVGKP